MRALRWVVPLPVAMGIVLAVACQTATQVTLQITTDVPCDRVGPIAITTGTDASQAAARAMSASTVRPTCKPIADRPGVNDLGTLVIAPGANRTKPFNVQVTLQVERQDRTGMETIWAKRRVTGFVGGRDAPLPIHLEGACANMVCSESTSCRAGVCEEIPVVDPGCDGGCPPPPPPIDAGPDADGGAGDAGTCVSPFDGLPIQNTGIQRWSLSSDIVSPDGGAAGLKLVDGPPGCGKAAAGISAPVELVVGDGDRFAFGLWVRAATPRSQDFTLAERIDPTGIGGDVGWRLSIDPNGTLSLEEIQAGGVVAVVTAPKAPLDAQWHRVAVSTNNVKGSTVYVDGAALVSGGGGTYPVNPAGWYLVLPPHPFDVDEIVYAAFQ